MQARWLEDRVEAAPFQGAAMDHCNEAGIESHCDQKLSSDFEQGHNLTVFGSTSYQDNLAS